VLSQQVNSEQVEIEEALYGLGGGFWGGANSGYVPASFFSGSA
jgi:hypothetical protein